MSGFRVTFGSEGKGFLGGGLYGYEAAIQFVWPEPTSLPNSFVKASPPAKVTKFEMNCTVFAPTNNDVINRGRGSLAGDGTAAKMRRLCCDLVPAGGWAFEEINGSIEGTADCTEIAILGKLCRKGKREIEPDTLEVVDIKYHGAESRNKSLPVPM